MVGRARAAARNAPCESRGNTRTTPKATSRYWGVRVCPSDEVRSSTRRVLGRQRDPANRRDPPRARSYTGDLRHSAPAPESMGMSYSTTTREAKGERKRLLCEHQKLRPARRNRAMGRAMKESVEASAARALPLGARPHVAVVLLCVGAERASGACACHKCTCPGGGAGYDPLARALVDRVTDFRSHFGQHRAAAAPRPVQLSLSARVCAAGATASGWARAGPPSPPPRQPPRP